MMPKLVVTGANGNVGRQVVAQLLRDGATNVVAASRNPEQLTELKNLGADLVHADFDEPDTLDAAFSGARRVLIISTNALGVPGQRLRQHKAAVDAATRAGMDRIVYTSMANPEPGSPIPFAPDHLETERAVRESGVPFTILRPNWYMESLLISLPQALVSGQWYSAAGGGRTAYVARADVSRTAAACLLGELSENEVIDVSGPAALTVADVAAIANSVLDANINVIEVSAEQLAGGLASGGIPGPLAELLVAMDLNTKIGRMDVVSDAVERLTGRPPQSVRDFIEENRAALKPETN